MGKELLFHIGTFKTATTSLQTFFKSNRDRLLDEGYYYPENLLTEGFVDRNNGNIYPLALAIYSPQFERGVKNLKELFKKYDKILLSGEDFWGVADKRERLEMFKDTDVSVKVIVYLRRQDKYVDSLCNQLIKSGDLCIRQGDSLPLVLDWFYIDYYAELKKIENAVGKENIIVRIYEREQLYRRDICADFLKSVGIKVENNYINENEKVNESLTNNYRELKNVCNMALGTRRPINGNFFYAIEALSEEQRKTSSTIFPSNLLSPEEKLEILQRSAENNKKIAKEFLGREDGMLFYEPLPDPKEAYGREPLDLESSIKLFTRLIMGHNRAIAELEQKIASLNTAIEEQKTIEGSTFRKIVNPCMRIADYFRRK